MNRAGFPATLSLLTLGIGLCAAPLQAQVSAVPPLMSFSGRLVNPDGNPVPDGTYSIRFSLWDDAAAGTEKWNQTLDTVNVKNGTFSTLLLVDTANLFDGDLWLEIKVGADDPLTPRQRLVSTAYAMKAGTVPDGSITSDKIADGAITAAKLDANIFTNGNVWSLTGNAGLDPATNFLGTTDGQPLVFKTNNTEWMRLLTNGYFGIGTNNPLAPLHVVGGPIWTTKFLKTIALDNREAIEFGQGYSTGPRWGLAASGSNFYLFSTPNEDASGLPNYKLTVRGDTGNIGINYTIPNYPLTVGANGAGIVQTDGTVTVGTYVNGQGGWFGTYSNHPLNFFTNNGGASLTLTSYQLISAASDFILRGRGGGAGNNGGSGRALVDNGSGGLVINFANDFGKVVIGSDTTVLGQMTANTLQLQGADLAEKFDVQAEVAPGMVVEIDPDHEGSLKMASGAYNRRVAGIVSGAGKLPAGVVLSDPKDKAMHSQPVAMSGRVWVYTDATEHAVEPGDFMTTAERPGHAMPVSNLAKAQGAILGKAMTHLEKGKVGLVLVLVNLQ